MKRKAILIILCLASLLLMGSVRAPIMPTVDFYVNDAARALYNGHKKTMMNIAAELEEATGIQLVVLTVTSAGEMTLEEYARDVFLGWEIGGRERQDGILFLFTSSPSQCVIYTGTGMEELLSAGDIGGMVTYIGETAQKGNASKALLEGVKSAASRIYEAKGMQPGPVLEQSLQGTSSTRDLATPMLMVAVIAIVMGRSLRIASRNRKRLGRGPIHARKDFTKRVNHDHEFDKKARSQNYQNPENKNAPVVEIYPVEGDIYLEDLAHVPLKYPSDDDDGREA